MRPIKLNEKRDATWAGTIAAIRPLRRGAHSAREAVLIGLARSCSGCWSDRKTRQDPAGRMWPAGVEQELEEQQVGMVDLTDAHELDLEIGELVSIDVDVKERVRANSLEADSK